MQRRGTSLLMPGSTEIVDTRTSLPADPAISSAATAARRRAKADASEAIEAAREAFLDAEGGALLAPEDRDSPDKREAARAVVRRAVENNVLTADFPVEVETAPAYFETVTVGRILDDRLAFHGRLTRNPLEPAMTADGAARRSEAPREAPAGGDQRVELAGAVFPSAG